MEDKIDFSHRLNKAVEIEEVTLYQREPWQLLGVSQEFNLPGRQIIISPQPRDRYATDGPPGYCR